jgi:membrane protein
VANSLFSLRGLPLKEVAKRTWAEILNNDVFGHAAQLAYYFFLALFPFLIFVIASLSVFGAADRGRELLFRFFAQALPPPAFHLVAKTFDEIIRSSGPLKMSFGIVASLWSASMGMSAIMDTLNAAFKVKETRSLFKQYAEAIGLTVGIALLLVISVVIAVFGDAIINALSLGEVVAVTWRIAQWPLALILLAFAVIYYLAPNLPNRRWHWLTPGAILAVISWMVVSFGLRIYLHFVSTYSVAYGSLGAAIVLLLWFYLSGAAVLSGAVLNAVLETSAASAGRTEQRDRSPSKAA